MIIIDVPSSQQSLVFQTSARLADYFNPPSQERLYHVLPHPSVSIEQPRQSHRMTIFFFFLPLVFLSLLSSITCLLLNNVTVPPFKIGGGSAMLGCDFDPQGEQVYSVKWYKGGQEIYRYMPSNKLHPVAVFPRPGVIINEVRVGILSKISL